ncbi:MAG: PA14 domain-containing protein [Vicinamibacterales bacterium]
MPSSRLARLLAALYWCAALTFAFAVGEQWRYEDGLRLSAWRNPTWSGPPAYVDLDTTLSNDLIGRNPFPLWPAFSIEWAGDLAVDVAGDYTFALNSDDGSTLEVDGAMVVDNGGEHRARRVTGGLRLERGLHPIRVRYFQAGGRSTLSVLWSKDGGPFQPMPATQLVPEPMSCTTYQLRPWRAPLVTAVALLCTFGVFLGVWPWLRRLAALDAASTLGRALVTLESPRAAMLLIAGVGVAVRLAMIESTPAVLWPDSHVFYVTAQEILRGHWASHDPYRTLVYPWILAAAFAGGESPLVGTLVIAAQMAMGVASALLFYTAARRAVTPLMALAAGLLAVVHATQLYYEAAVLTEALFTFTLAITVWLAVRTIEAPAWPRAAALGLATAVLVLVRPVAQWYVLVPIAVCLLARAPLARRMMAVAALVACYAAPVVWWMGVNQREYGFFGIALGRGMGLYTRVFDIDRLEPPPTSSEPELRELFGFARLEAWSPNRVRDELNYVRRFTAASADDAMFRFSMETLRAHLPSFAIGTVRQWLQQLAEPYSGVRSCPSGFGRYLCSGRTDEESLRPFPNEPTAPSLLRAITVRYVEDWQPPMKPVVMLAFVGVVAVGLAAPWGASLLLAGTVAYLTLVPAITLAPQDRFRLPVDPLIFAFAFAGLAALTAWTSGLADRVRGDAPNPQTPR